MSSSAMSNPRGIPRAHFVVRKKEREKNEKNEKKEKKARTEGAFCSQENVEEYMFTQKSAEETIHDFEDQYRYHHTHFFFFFVVWRGFSFLNFILAVWVFLPSPSDSLSLPFPRCRKYKFMEMNTQQRKKQIVGKLPEIKSNLETVEFLLAKKESNEPVETKFELSDTLFATANIKEKDKVFLWLGV